MKWKRKDKSGHERSTSPRKSVFILIEETKVFEILKRVQIDEEGSELEERRKRKFILGFPDS